MAEPAKRSRKDIRARRGRVIEQMDWRQLRNPYHPVKVITDDQLEALHQASLDILETLGIRVTLPEARENLRRAGALLDEDTLVVRLGRDIVEHALRSLPGSVTMTPRNAQRAVTIGHDMLCFASVLGPPYCSDMEKGRRDGNWIDYCDLLRLAQFFNIIHLVGGSPVEPLDLPVPTRHLDATLAMLTLTDKVPYVFCQSQRRIHDVFAMIAIARKISLEELASTSSTYSIINTNSPLQYDSPMATGVIEMARFGQPILITPFTLAGATTPATLAGAMAMCNAEILFGVTLSQLARPGAPVVYGCATAAVDMKTGAPAFAMPEYCKAAQIAGQLARRYGMPLRSSNFCSSNTVDAQAAYEAQGSTWAAIMGGVNLLMHAAGWLEGGLCASFEKFVVDVEILQMMASYLEPTRIDSDTLALSEMAEVGHGGHFFGTGRTIANFERAFYRPILSNTRNYGSWVEQGSQDAMQRSHEIYKHALREYEQPHLDADTKEALEAFVARRKSEGGAPFV